MEINPFVVEIDLISIAILLMVRYGITERASRLREVHVFRYLVDLSIAFCVLNSTGQFIPSTYIPVIKIINGLKIVTCICMGCSWFLTVFFITSTSTYHLRKKFIPILLPSLVVSVMAIIDVLSNLTEPPLDMRPHVWILLNILTIVYVVSASILCLTKARKCTNRIRRRSLYLLSGAMAFPLLLLMVQAKFYDMPITSPSFVIVTLFVHLCALRGRITVDEITKLNNDNKLADYLEAITQKQNPAKRLFFLKIDIDKFKAMKKKYGGVAAAIALQKMASFLRQQCINRGSFIARYSTSSFAIVTECNDFSEIETLANRLIATSATSEELAQGPWPITFSIYWSEFGTPTTKTVDDLIENSTRNCYKPSVDGE